LQGTLLALPTILEILYVLALLALLTAQRAPAVLGQTAMLVAKCNQQSMLC